MIKRTLEKKLKRVSRTFPVIMLSGPRQSGKTTLVRNLFSTKPYVSFENIDTQEYALNDPRSFLASYPKGAIFDEVQRVPSIFSYLQGIVDEKKEAGLFILTGSHHFLLLEKISQSLAGRAAILHLLPFSFDEIRGTRFEPKSLEDAIFTGMFPAVYDKRADPLDWYPSYISTYVERDVRLVKNIGDLITFQKFMKMCAARTAQILNLSSIANDCGITHNTAKAWISVLEASFIVHLIQPHHANLAKRLVKSPKLYFHDTGLVCSLLNIQSKKEIETHAQRGALFETFIFSEFIKKRFNAGKRSNLYFWRDKTGHEIDCVIENASSTCLVEIKSGKTITSDYTKNLEYWNRIAKIKGKSFIIFAGDHGQERSNATVLSWKNLDAIPSLDV